MYLSRNGFRNKAYSVRLKVQSHYFAIDNALNTHNFLARVAHPNIKLFIYQGGLQSTEEAVHYAVPLLGISIVFDQYTRLQRLASLGVAIHIKFNELTKENLDVAIRRILTDKRYIVTTM